MKLIKFKNGYLTEDNLKTITYGEFLRFEPGITSDEFYKITGRKRPVKKVEEPKKVFKKKVKES